jgi:hypothetical protein
MLKRLLGVVTVLAGCVTVPAESQDLPARFQLTCDSVTQPEQKYDVSLAPNSRCLVIDDGATHEVCEVQWWPEMGKGRAAIDLRSDVAAKAEFRDFTADGCRFKFVMALQSQSVTCDYDKQRKDVALFCRDAGQWLQTVTPLSDKVQDLRVVPAVSSLLSGRTFEGDDGVRYRFGELIPRQEGSATMIVTVTFADGSEAQINQVFAAAEEGVEMRETSGDVANRYLVTYSERGILTLKPVSLNPILAFGCRQGDGKTTCQVKVRDANGLEKTVTRREP